MIRVQLPYHLRNLARTGQEVQLDLRSETTLGDLLLALENRYPVLKGSIRSHGSLQRRPFLRYFACGQDLSHSPETTPLPTDIQNGREPFIILGAIAGG